MALTKVQKTGITDNAIDADKIEDGTIVAADIAPGTITNAKLAGSIANDKLANSSITVNGTSVSLGGSVSAGKVQWQAVKTASFTAVAGEGYFIDTTSSAITATLPASPSAGDTVAFKDYAATFNTNNLTIARNGSNIQGAANDSLISTNRASVVLVYIDGTKGWLYTNESNVAALGPTFISATGGTVTTSGDYKIHTFTGDGCFVVSSLGSNIPCAQASTVDYLVIAGGAGGGRGGAGEGGGGGGAGGYRESSGTTHGCYTVSPLGTGVPGATVTASTYPITVGAGGSGVGSGGACSTATNGSNSVFSTITSTGGGGGKSQLCSPGTGDAQPGGSGGGGNGQGPQGRSEGGLGNTPPVSPPQGNAGGPGSPVPAPTNYSGGGGGGAGSSGKSGWPAAAGNPAGPGSEAKGGTGVTSCITGSPVTRAGGGGGGSAYTHNPAPSGGAGQGAYSPCQASTCGTANTGGGGGGGSGAQRSGSSGGKGIIIIRYKYQ